MIFLYFFVDFIFFTHYIYNQHGRTNQKGQKMYNQSGQINKMGKEGKKSTDSHERWDFFFRSEGQNFHEKWFGPKPRPAYFIQVLMPRDSSIEDAWKEALRLGMPQGSNRSGCHEVQNDTHVWKSVKNNRINIKTLNNVVCKTWDELCEEEEIDDTEV